MEQENYTLRSLELAFDSWQTKLRFLGYLVYNLHNRKGGEILTVLNTVLKHGNPTGRVKSSKSKFKSMNKSTCVYDVIFSFMA